MKNFLLKLWKDDDGAEMVEWAIVVGLVVLAGRYRWLCPFRIERIHDYQ